ncbi:MAG: hypothetical protein E3J54_00480 [Actinobacteria bacterium]|nr:MAG: hypothetical protein E3J54_00480 [Actinomycetota bacterium]
MICPRCGWAMHLLNIREHNKYEDSLYQCICGTTHLQIKPKAKKDELKDNLYPRIETGEERM